MAEEFQKTPAKADRWFKAAIVLALLYGATFSLHSIFNWIFFCASGYAFFMSYFLLPVQPKIFQQKRRQERNWTGQAETGNQFGGGATSQPQNAVTVIKRVMFTIVGGVFALFMFFFVKELVDPTPEGTNTEYTDLYAEGAEPTAQDLVNRGNDLFNDQQYDSAWKYYDLAATADNSNMEAVYGKGIVRYQQDKKEEAMTWFRQSYEGGFRYSWLSWVLAEMNEKNGNATQAISLYKESVSLDSTYVDSYKRLAELEPSNRDKYLKLAEKHASN